MKLFAMLATFATILLAIPAMTLASAPPPLEVTLPAPVEAPSVKPSVKEDVRWHGWTPAGQVVDRDCLLGQQHGVPVRVPGHQAADAHPFGRLRHSGLQGPALEDGPVGTAVADRCKVVEVPYVVEACFVGDPPDRAKGFDGGVLP